MQDAAEVKRVHAADIAEVKRQAKESEEEKLKVFGVREKHERALGFGLCDRHL